MLIFACQISADCVKVILYLFVAAVRQKAVLESPDADGREGQFLFPKNVGHISYLSNVTLDVFFILDPDS